MKHFPIFVALENRPVVLSGGGEAALAKLRLLLKTEANLSVFAPAPAREIETWAAEGRLTLHKRRLEPADTAGAVLVYAADEDAAQDARTADIARAAGALVNIVDNLDDSQFITPAIVDRDPVTVAIGTEGAAPVLARAIKSDLEERLPATLGTLARLGKAFRKTVEVLPFGRARREFWADFYFNAGPRALHDGGESAVKSALQTLLGKHQNANTPEGHVAFVGAGPGDPDLLTLKARKALDTADVVIHDHLVAPAILELARREAILIDAGVGSAMKQDETNALITRHAAKGAQVVRLKTGDPAQFGRLDAEIEAVEAAGLAWHVVPGISATPAIGPSLTKRTRASAIHFPAMTVPGRAHHNTQTVLSQAEQELA